jgi:hypothetical protein
MSGQGGQLIDDGIRPDLGDHLLSLMQRQAHQRVTGAAPNSVTARDEI